MAISISHCRNSRLDYFGSIHFLNPILHSHAGSTQEHRQIAQYYESQGNKIKAGNQYLAIGDHLQAVRLYLASATHEAVQKSLSVLRVTHDSAIADLVIEHVNNGDGLWGASNDDSSMLIDMYAALDRLEEGA